jgi:hypothetical protein
MNTKISLGIRILGGFLVALAVGLYFGRASAATGSSNLNQIGAITTRHSSMPNYPAAKDSPAEFIQIASIASQNLSPAEYFAKDLQLEYRPFAESLVFASNPSEGAQYFAQDLYAEYGMEVRGK